MIVAPASREAQHKQTEDIPPEPPTEEIATLVVQPAATQNEEITDVDNITAKHIAHEDNVPEPADAVLPQITEPMVSSPVHTDSEYVSIGDLAMPLTEDDYWQEEHPNTPIHEVLPHTPPAPVATPVLASLESPFKNIVTDEPSLDAAPLRHLRKGPRPGSTMLTFHEDITASVVQNL
jgi:hypothetical protein